MSRLDRILETGAEPAPRYVQRRVGVVVVILIVALTGWAVSKRALTGGLADSEIEAGLDDLAAAIDGSDPEGFAAAEDHFVDAASISVVDRYPAFLISSARTIRAPDGAAPHGQIAKLVGEGELGAAREQMAQLERDSPQAARMWGRLIDGLELRLDQ